jgi:acetyl-CoA carboxylase biotin carboxyl carrier protein
MAIIDIRCDITGTIWKIVKAIGDPVAEDEPILILESMKMEIPLVAPEPGVVVEIAGKEGDTASEGSVLVRIKV